MLSNATVSRRRLLYITICFEGALGASALVWIELRDLVVPSPLSLHLVMLALFMTVPLLLLNGILYFSTVRKSASNSFAEFFYEVIAPICKNQSVASALCIGIVSGAAEELFFRGALQTELLNVLPFWVAIGITNIIFACGHFIGALRRYAGLVLLYAVFGAYFSLLYEFAGSIWVPSITHAVYNTTVILSLSRLLQSAPGNSALCLLAESSRGK